MDIIDSILNPNNKEVLEIGDKVNVCSYEEAVALGYKSKINNPIKWGKESGTINVVYNRHAKDKKMWYSIKENIYVYPREWLTRVK